MKKNSASCGICAAVILSVILSAGSGRFLFAAEKVPDTSATQVQNSDKNTGSYGPVDPQNTEKLLYTLNETLQENRKIRQSMRDLQTAFEKVTIEKSDIADQMRKVEQMAIQRNREIGKKSEDLSVQLSGSKQEIEKLQAENKGAAGKNLELETKLEALDAENTKLQGLLKTAILDSERDQIVERMKQNDQAVQEAIHQVSSLDGENIALKGQLIQSYFDLGNMLYDLGRFEEAAVQYLNVLAWDPNHAWAHHNLAVIYDYHLHKVHTAMVHYRAYMHLKLASEDAAEARMRLWDLEQLVKVEPEQPLKEDFKKYQKI